MSDGSMSARFFNDDVVKSVVVTVETVAGVELPSTALDTRVLHTVRSECRMEFHRKKYESDRQATIDRLLGLVVNAGFTVTEAPEVVDNDYWPDSYAEARFREPWIIVSTTKGHIYLGPRKRVIHIDWRLLNIARPVEDIFGPETKSATTVSSTFVHAWDDEKARAYLRRLESVAVEESEVPTRFRLGHWSESTPAQQIISMTRAGLGGSNGLIGRDVVRVAGYINRHGNTWG